MGSWQCRKQANGRFEASLKLVSKLQEDASKWGAGSAGRQANGMFEASLKLVSRQFRKQRLAVWAAGRGAYPSFTAMVFEPCRRVL